MRRDQLLDPSDEPRQRLRRRLTTEHSATKQLRDLGQHFLSPLAMLNELQATPAPASCPRWRRSAAGETSNLTSKPSGVADPALNEASLDSRAETGTSERATRRSRTGDLLITNGSEGIPRRRWDPPPRRILLPEGPAPLTSGSSASAASFPNPARRVSRKGLILWILRGFCPPSTTSLDSVKRTLQMFT